MVFYFCSEKYKMDKINWVIPTVTLEQQWKFMFTIKFQCKWHAINLAADSCWFRTWRKDTWLHPAVMGGISQSFASTVGAFLLSAKAVHSSDLHQLIFWKQTKSKKQLAIEYYSVSTYILQWVSFHWFCVHSTFFYDIRIRKTKN